MEKSAGKPKIGVLAGNNAPKREVTLCACAIQDGGPEVPSMPQSSEGFRENPNRKSAGKAEIAVLAGKLALDRK